VANPKTGRNGSRVSQRKHAERKKRGRPTTKHALTVDDFDLSLTKHVGGNNVDPVEGREARLPYVIRGMRENKSIREIAFECNCAPSTISYDKTWVLEEAWTLRQDLIGLWLEEQLQQYEEFLGLLRKELLFKRDVEGEESEERVNLTIMDKMLGVMDKVNELKGLRQNVPLLVGINAGANATINVNQDADAARELLDFLKSGKMGSGKTTLVS